MNLKSKGLFLLVILVGTMNFNMLSYAMSIGFEVEEMEVDNESGVLKNCKFTFLEHNSQTDTIECFAVNDDGYIAVGFKTQSPRRLVQIYNKKNEFLYGYTFVVYGTYGLEWDEDNIVICLNREEIALAFDDKGNCIDKAKILDTFENMMYWDKAIFSTKKVVNGDTYIITNNNKLLDLLHGSYYKLIKIDKDGNEIILYADNGKQILPTIFKILAGLSVVVVIIIVSINVLASYERYNKSEKM